MSFPKLLLNAQPPAFITALAILVVLWIFHRFTTGQRKGAKRLPSGPAPWPIVGNFLQLGKLPHRSLAHIAMKYGPIMSLRLGSVPTVVVSSAAMAKVVLKTQDLIFASRPQSASGKYFAYDYKDVVFTSYGPYWRQMKKLCMVEMFNARRLQSFAPILEEELVFALRSMWEESREGKSAVNVSKILSSVIQAQVLQILSGTKSDDYHSNGNGKEIKDLLWEMSHLAGTFNIGEFIPWIDWLDLQGIKRRMRKAIKSFDQIASKIIEEHKKRRSASSLDKEKKHPFTTDVIDTLLEMQSNDSITITTENIKAIVFDLFAAGVETSSTMLEWAMSLIIQNPSVAKKLREEIEGVVDRERAVKSSDVESMEYLRCVVKETLRLYPPVPLLLPHKSTQASTIDGYFIPENSRLIVNAWALARDPAVWKDPLEFMPDRWMGKDDDFVKAKEFFDMIPFGAGRRGCPGATMAMATMTLTIAQLVHCFEWRVEGELDMTENFGATMPRKHDLFAFPTLRLPTCPS
ncbi:cytochrome P450 750A1 [Cryptomeria japonica]|uniref:cytochrome P450 750A1 n=1 Tax=Cryptomeria japonica TaxID=3369 RepID=UPI0025AD8A69|nr:cytochrome P450 750A1 [Cryptomeria japonica]